MTTVTFNQNSITFVVFYTRKRLCFVYIFTNSTPLLPHFFTFSSFTGVSLSHFLLSSIIDPFTVRIASWVIRTSSTDIGQILRVLFQEFQRCRLILPLWIKFRVDKISRFSRFLIKTEKLNPREIH